MVHVHATIIAVETCVFIFVALGIQHAMRIHNIII